MLAVKNNRKSYNIKLDIQHTTEFHNQGKQITLSKVPVPMGIKGNEKADKAAKQAIDIPDMTTTRLPYTDYYLPSGGLGTPKGKGYWKIVVASYTKLNHTSKNGKVLTTAVGNQVKLSRICIGHNRLTHCHLMSRNIQQPTFRNAVCGNQRLTIKHFLQDCPHWSDSKKKYNIQGNDCEVMLCKLMNI